MSDFDRKWLTLWALGVVVFGVVLALGGVKATQDLPYMLFDLLGSHGAPQTTAHLEFATALMGAVSIGWGITLLAAFKAAWMLDGAQAKSVWTWITGAAFAWYVIDGYLSAHTGFALNIVPNTVLFVAFLIPVLRSGVLKG